jgi:hypothetical protein
MNMNLNRITVLCEYKVADEKRKDFMALLPAVKRDLEGLGAVQISIFEGTDQPCLFVEEFIVADMEVYESLKKARNEEVSPVWEQQHACVPGGKNKVHIWAFAKLDF